MQVNFSQQFCMISQSCHKRNSRMMSHPVYKLEENVKQPLRYFHFSRSAEHDVFSSLVWVCVHTSLQHCCVTDNDILISSSCSSMQRSVSQVHFVAVLQCSSCCRDRNSRSLQLTETQMQWSMNKALTLKWLIYLQSCSFQVLLKWYKTCSKSTYLPWGSHGKSNCWVLFFTDFLIDTSLMWITASRKVCRL